MNIGSYRAMPHGWRPMVADDAERDDMLFGLWMRDGTLSVTDDGEITWHLNGNEGAQAWVVDRLQAGMTWEQVKEEANRG